MYKDAHVTVIVSNLQKSLEFYNETLGMEIKEHAPEHWAEVGMPGLTIGLHPSRPGEHPTPTESMSIGLQVDNMDEAMITLRTRGVVFLPEAIDDDFVKLSFFKDPDGNPLYLCQFKQI